MFRRLVLAASSLTVTAIALALVAGAGFSRPASALTNCSTGTQAISDQEQQLVTRINEFRVANGLNALKLSPSLSRAAAWMSEDLVSHGIFSHTDSLGRSAFARVQQCGYSSSGAGENIAAGTGGADGVFRAWEGSADHRQNMLKPNWTVIGVGKTGYVWTADFGSYDDSSGPWDSPLPTTVPTVRPTQPPANSPTVAPPTPLATATPFLQIVRRATVPLIATE